MGGGEDKVIEREAEAAPLTDWTLCGAGCCAGAGGGSRPLPRLPSL